MAEGEPETLPINGAISNFVPSKRLNPVSRPGEPGLINSVYRERGKQRVTIARKPRGGHRLPRPISFFVHHQGRGHARRCQAIIEAMDDRPIHVLTADPGLFDGFSRDIVMHALPNMIGAPQATRALEAHPTPSVLHCVPLGIDQMRRHMGLISTHLLEDDPGLFVSDVSAEIALLCRIHSVPAVKVRMHGNRGDIGHLGAYEACVGMLAPFAEVLEQDDYPEWARRKTHYTGGLCTTTAPVPSREDARAQLRIDAQKTLIVTLTGGGGSGTPWAPLTVGARAAPDAEWVVLGPVHREGHETDFANLRNEGWVDNVTTWLAAADIVIASAGDNTVHEIARVGRPFLCIPEWRYFDEQWRKADALVRANAAAMLPAWPGDLPGWRDALERARSIDLDAQRALFDAGAARDAADWLMATCDELWAGAE